MPSIKTPPHPSWLAIFKPPTMSTLKSLTVTFTILLYLFNFSSARISLPLNLPENNVVDRDSSISFPDSNSKQTLLLPSQKPESSDQNNFVELEPESTHNQAGGSDQDLTVTLTQSTNNKPGGTDQELSVPQTQSAKIEYGGSDQDLPVLSNSISVETLHLNPSSYIRIRPINRHFRMKPSLFRIYRCHHHNHMNRGHQGREVPYGDDMILAGETIDHFDPSILPDSIRPTPEKWGRIHHHHHHHDKDDSIMMMRHPFRQYIAKQRFKRKIEENEKRKERDEKKEGGFMKSIRKFLHHF